MPRDQTARGVLYLCLGVLVFSLQDAVIKQVSGGYALTQVVTIRSVVALPILLWLIQREVGLPALLRMTQFGPLAARALVLFVSYMAYYLAIPALPLARAVSLYFTVPLFVIALAAPTLGERASAGVWAAVAVGFVGVLVMLQPGMERFEAAALLSLLAAAMYALSMLMARQLGDTQAASVMAFYQNGAFLVGALVVAGVFALAGNADGTPGQHPSMAFLMRPWVWPTARDALLMASTGVVAAAGMTLLTAAYRVARASAVTPFEYTGMLWAPTWGLLFFGEVPRASTVAGALLIVGAGLYALRAARHN